MRRRGNKSDVKSCSLTTELHLKLLLWSVGEVGGILGVGVKSVEIKRNTHCEGDLLEHY